MDADPLVLFYHSSSPFSNWYLAKFTMPAEGTPTLVETYNCVEQRMMHAKALMFGDHTAARQIMAARTPKAQKSIGRRVQGFDETSWVARRYEVVLEAVTAKFAQNPHLLAILLRHPVNARFAEASPSDRIWGIGLSASDPRAPHPALWRGLNLLGKATSEARRTLEPHRGFEPADPNENALSDAELDAFLADL